MDLIGQAEVQFSGNANELIAGYAADGDGNPFRNFHFNALTSVGMRESMEPVPLSPLSGQVSCLHTALMLVPSPNLSQSAMWLGTLVSHPSWPKKYGADSLRRDRYEESYTHAPYPWHRRL